MIIHFQIGVLQAITDIESIEGFDSLVLFLPVFVFDHHICYFNDF